MPPRGWRSWTEATEAEWAVARERERVIRALAEGMANRAAVDEAMVTLDLSRSVVYELVRRYRRRPQTSSLLPLKSGRHTHAHFLGPDREELLAVTIRQFYLTPQRPPLAALFQEVRLRFAQHRLKPPHYRTVRQRVQQLPSHLVLQRREGAKSARAKLGPVLASTLRADSPLDVVQIDHTPADVIVVDQENRLPIGRPCLSLAIDVASRMVMGFQVSLEPPSALAVSLVLTHAVLPKAEWLADRELPTVEWPACGLPDRIHVDNGKEFHSEAFARACQEHGIEVEYRPREQPHFGGHVERLIGTMMGAVHLLPGTTFSNPQEKASYDAEGRAVLTLPELERWLGLQIAGVYLSSAGRPSRPGRRGWHEGSCRCGFLRIRRRSSWIFSPVSPGESSGTAFISTGFGTGATCSAHGPGGERSRSLSSTTHGTCRVCTCATLAVAIGPSPTPTSACLRSRCGSCSK